MTSLSDAENRVAELEAELEALKMSTTQALEQSWTEVERIRRNASSASSCTSSKPSLVSSTTSGSDYQGSPLDRSSNDVFDGISVYPDGEDDPSAMSWSTSTLFSDTFVSLGMSNWSQQREQRKQTKIERDLMRQLQVLQEDKVRTVSELELKLSQREAAIETLETALIVKDQTVQTIREELDELRFKPSPVTKPTAARRTRSRSCDADICFEDYHGETERPEFPRRRLKKASQSFSPAEEGEFVFSFERRDSLEVCVPTESSHEKKERRSSESTAERKERRSSGSTRERKPRRVSARKSFASLSMDSV